MRAAPPGTPQAGGGVNRFLRIPCRAATLRAGGPTNKDGSPCDRKGNEGSGRPGPYGSSSAPISTREKNTAALAGPFIHQSTIRQDGKQAVGVKGRAACAYKWGSAAQGKPFRGKS